MAIPPLFARYFGAQLERTVEDWDAATLGAYQTDAVAELLAHVAANSPFYQRKFAAAGVSPSDFHAFDDLARFPFTTKDELRGDPWILQSMPRTEVRQVHTS